MLIFFIVFNGVLFLRFYQLAEKCSHHFQQWIGWVWVGLCVHSLGINETLTFVLFHYCLEMLHDGITKLLCCAFHYPPPWAKKRSLPILSLLPCNILSLSALKKQQPHAPRYHQRKYHFHSS